MTHHDSNFILDFVANFFIRHMVFVGNVQKLSIESNPNGLDPSLEFCCQGPVLTGIRKLNKMSIGISLTLEASEMFLSLHMIFSLARVAVVWAILEGISGFHPS